MDTVKSLYCNLPKIGRFKSFSTSERQKSTDYLEILGKGSNAKS